MTGELAAPGSATKSLERDGHVGTIPSLDGLRAISIVFVIIGHAIKEEPRSFLFRLFVEHAGLGVNIFFVISGFLITHLLLREHEKFGNVSLRLFYFRRALRILPAFLLFAGTVAILSWLGIVPVAHYFWGYVFTWTVNFAPSDHRVWVLAHLWSLSVEEQFYLLWPLVVRVGKKSLWANVAVLAIFAGPFTHALQTIFHFHLTTDAFPFACGPIAAGCLLALYAGPIRKAITSSKLLSSGWMLAGATISVVVFDAFVGMPAPVIVLTQLSMDLLITFCVAHVVFVSKGTGPTILNSGPFIVVGRLSYSLYLWQQLFTNPFATVPIPTPFPANIVLIFVAACTSYWGLELRFLRWRKKARRV